MDVRQYCKGYPTIKALGVAEDDEERVGGPDNLRSEDDCSRHSSNG